MEVTQNLHPNPLTEKIVNITKILVGKNYHDLFTNHTNFFLSLVPSLLGIKVTSLESANAVPLNYYGISLNISGSGKSYSIDILENQLFYAFFDKYNLLFEEKAFKTVEERVIASGVKPQDEEFETKLKNELKRYESYGAFVNLFSEGTSPAIKQLCQKVIYNNLGSVNMMVDEVGQYLNARQEELSLFLELYENGTTKTKLLKHSKENPRGAVERGMSPANLLMFGTPNKLFGGGSTEDAFYENMESGYARRCFFYYNDEADNTVPTLTGDRTDDLIQIKQSGVMQQLATMIAQKANPAYFNKVIPVSMDIYKYLGQLENVWREEAQKYQDDVSATLLFAELDNRKLKVLKLAAVFAFWDNPKNGITRDHIDQACYYVVKSHEYLKKICIREDAYVKLGRYVLNSSTPLTQTDLLSRKLPFYTGSTQQRKELMDLAIEWAYTQGGIIKENYILNGKIKQYEPVKLEHTNLEQLTFSVSPDEKSFADGWRNFSTSVDNLSKLVATTKGDKWFCMHHLEEGKRREDHVKKGFCITALDIDGTANMNHVKEFFKPFKYLMYTTKSHTAEEHHFRVLLFNNYILNLDKNEYTEYMKNVYEALPFKVDESTKDRSRMWATNSKAEVYTNLGEDTQYFNALDYVEWTKDRERSKEILNKTNGDGLMGWFLRTIEQVGCRNVHLYRYKKYLADLGFDEVEVKNKVNKLNKHLSNPLSQYEVDNILRKEETPE